jgi:hypothetical protein
VTPLRIVLCEPAAGDINPTTGVCACGCGRCSLDYDMRVRRGDPDPRIVQGIGPHRGLQERAVLARAGAALDHYHA